MEPLYHYQGTKGVFSFQRWICTESTCGHDSSHPPLCRGHLVLQFGRLLLSLALCPPLTLPLLCAAYLYLFHPASPSLLMDGVSLSLRGTASALNSWHFHGCWLFPLMCVGVWPVWLMAWTLCTWREAAADKDNTTPTKPHSD